MSKRNASKRSNLRHLGFFRSKAPSTVYQTDTSVSSTNRRNELKGGSEVEKPLVLPGVTVSETVGWNYQATPPRDTDTKLAAIASAGIVPLASAGRQLNFWEVAYREILDDKDGETKAIVEAYDALLDRVAQQCAEEAGENEALRETTVGGPESAHSPSDSESTEGGDAVTKRRVGCEEEMRSIAVANLGEMQRKEWVMKWNGQVFTVREQVTRIVKIMQHVSGLVGQAASSNPSAGLAWAGVCVILPLIINDTEEREAAINGVEDVAHIVARFRTVEDDYVSGRFGTNADFEKSLVSLYRSLAYFYMKSACYFAKSTSFRTIRGLVAADAWVSTLDLVKKAETECYRFATMLGCSSSLEKIDKVLVDLARMEFKDLIKDVEDWLIPDVNVAQMHQAKLPKLTSGYDKAGSWLLESPEFKSWEEEAGGQFWIKGPIGTGKSSLVAIIVDRMLRTTKSDLAFFYCTGDQMGATQVPKSMEDDVSASRVLRGLLGQLAMSPDRRRIAEEIEVAFNRSSQPGALGRVPLSLKDAKDLLVKVINSRRATTIIVDGLDEVSNPRHLLRTLGDIHDKADPGKLRLLLASQSVAPVDTYFPSVRLAVAGGPKSITDMKSFISGRVRQFNESSTVTLGSDLSQDIVETLSNKAEGMFKWAELCLARVLDDEKLPAEIGEYWESVKLQQFRGLLVDLVGSYEYLYNKSLPNGDSKQRGIVQRAVQRAFLWALAAGDLREALFRELQTGENNEASAGQTYKVLQNFLQVSIESITALHSSVWDFVSLKVTDRVDEFTKAAESEDQSYKSQESILEEAKEAAVSKALHQIAADCLKIVLEIPPGETETPSEKRSKTGLGHMQPSALLQYASTSWIKYSEALRSSGRDSDSLADLRKALFEPANAVAFQRWTQLHDHSLWWDPSITEPPDPLYYAVETGFDDVVRLVLDKTARSSWRGGRLGKALQLACYQGKISIVGEILREVDVNESDNVIGTPLHAALAGRRTEICQLLMDEYGADVNAPSPAFGNAVQMALATDDRDLLESLVNHGALYDPCDYRERIWAKAWRLTPEPILHESVIIASVRNVLLDARESLKLSPYTGPPMDADLESLHNCVVYQREAAALAQHQKGFILSSLAAQQMQAASITTSGYITTILTWAVLGFARHSLKRQEMVSKHHQFIQTFGDIIQDPDLEEVMAKLFKLIIIESVRRSHSDSRRSTWLQRVHNLGVKVVEERGREAEAIENLNRNAEELQRYLKDILAIRQRSAVMSTMDKMAGEISDMKQQITQLTSTVQLLLDLQQKPDTGNLSLNDPSLLAPQ